MIIVILVNLFQIAPVRTGSLQLQPNLVHRFYLIHKGRSPVTLTKLQPRNSNRSSRRFTPDAYNIIKSRTDRHLYSFLPRTIRDWNDLPLATTSMPSLDKFKAAIKKINNQ